MGARVYIVDKNTYPIHVAFGFIATGGDLGTLWVKTSLDLLADALATRVRDRVYFWEINNPNHGPGRGFVGPFEIVGPPYFDPTPISYVDEEGNVHDLPGKYSLRIPIEPREPRGFISEMELLGKRGRADDLWNIFYKKVLGRGRSATPISPAEEVFILELLSRREPVNLPSPQKAPPRVHQLSLSIPKKTLPFPRKGPPSTEFVDYRTLPTRDGSCFSYEKGLEAWICSNIDNPAHAGIRSIFGPPSRLAWFANYLANGINMSNMDFLAFHGGGERVERVSLVELKGESGGSDCAEQLDGYAEWLRNIVFPGEEVIIRKILIARRVSEEALDRVSGMTSGPHWFVSYEIDEGGQVNLQPLNFTPSYP